MIIDCCSDLHGDFPKLQGGDLLIVAGDLTSMDTLAQHMEFKEWLYKQDYRKKIVIAGNHDNHFVGLPSDPYIFSSYNTKTGEQLSYAEYLCDSGTEFEGLKIWGSPWTKTFEGINPSCCAFTVNTDEELAEKWSMIPDGIDILITHSPSFGNLDITRCGESAGSLSLWMTILSLGKLPKLHVFGHIHESYGIATHHNGLILVNAAHMTRQYNPWNKPIRVIL